MNTQNYQASIKELKALQKNSKERLKSARELIKIGNFRDSISRSYYAILDVARALLLSEGYFAKTHDGVITLFSLKFVKTKRIESKYVRIFKMVEKARLNADYDFLKEFTKQDAEDSYRKAQEFVSMVDKQLKEKLKSLKGNVTIQTILW